ncbi:MAG: nuclear transport factor 2 family protein [Nannocystales bacterium]
MGSQGSHLALALSLLLLACAPQASSDAVRCPEPVTATVPTNDPFAVVRLYLEANAAGDLDAAALLVTDESVVFESGGDEGSWSHYREHHLGPEVAMFAEFDIRSGDPQVSLSTDRSLASVTLPIEYDIELKDGREIESRGTVTFVLRYEGTQYLIEHIHWSSRPRAAPRPPQVAAEVATYKAAKEVFAKHCGGCHARGGAQWSEKAAAHFDMSSYPFGGHHAAEIDQEVLRSLGQSGRGATMPKSAPGSLSPDEMALIASWARAFAVAKDAGFHGEASHGDKGHGHK